MINRMNRRGSQGEGGRLGCEGGNGGKRQSRGSRIEGRGLRQPDGGEGGPLGKLRPQLGARGFPGLLAVEGQLLGTTPKARPSPFFHPSAFILQPCLMPSHAASMTQFGVGGVVSR
jgi:hypothetical protein